MAEEQLTNPQPPSVRMPENQLQSRVFQKMIIIKNNPALSDHGVKRKLDCSSGNLEKVQKPSRTPLAPCFSLPAGLVTETRGKYTFRFIKSSKPLIGVLPKSTVLQNRNPATVVIRSAGPGMVNLIYQNGQLVKTVKEAVISKTLSKEAPSLSKRLCFGGDTDPGRAKPIGKKILITKIVRISSHHDLLKPVESTRGQLINGPASNSSPAPHPLPLDDLPKNDLSIFQSAQNADSTLTTAVPITCEASAPCEVPPRPSKSITDLSDVGDHDMLPQIQCPVHFGECEFRTLNVGHLTDHVNWHMAAVPCLWCVLCHKCSAIFDNFLDVMLHCLQKKCSGMTVKVITICSDPANKVGRHENVKDSFSRPSVEKVAINTMTCHSVSSDFLAQKYVDRFWSPEIDSPRKPVNCHSVVSIEQMGLFLAVQSPVNANEFNVSSKWSVIRYGDPSSLAECQWQRSLPQIQLKKSAALSSSPAFETSSVSSKTAVVTDSQALQNATETDQVMEKCSETSSKSPTVTVPSLLFDQLVETKSASNNIQEVNLLVNVNNDVQPQLPSVAQSDKTVAVKSKCKSKQKTQKTLLLEKKATHSEPFQSEAVPIVDMSKNLNRSAYAEIKTLFIGQQNGINENFKVIIKKIDSKLQYQCPYCIYNSQSIFSVAKHLVQEEDKADLELSNNTISITTRTLLMHCRLCDYITHHHSSLLWHLQSIHDILDEPLTLNGNPVNSSEAAALHSRQTLHFRCVRFDECAFASTNISAVAQHSYQEHAGDGNMFGIGHVMCNKVSFGVCHDSSDMRITSQFVCAHCHVVTLSWKLFALHYLYRHASRLQYICMYCETHVNSVTAIIKHINDSHAEFKYMKCSVMFTGDLGEVETATIKSEQCPDVFVDTVTTPFSRIARPTRCHSVASVLSVPCADGCEDCIYR